MISVCIASYQDPEGAYLSIFSALAQLEKSDIEWEIINVADGGTEWKYENAHPNIRVLRYAGGNRLGSPQASRDMGIRNSRFKNVLCMDSHVIVSDIVEWAKEHERLGAALSFPAMTGASYEMWNLYASEFDWDKTFWNTHVYYKPKREKPYRVVQASHSGFMLDRDFYLSSGGYTDLQLGYGGEETFLALKAWMLGRENFMIPKVWHAHYQPAGRNEGAADKLDYKKNFLIAAYIFGGMEYLRKCEQNYNVKLHITQKIEEERKRICAGPYRGDLDLFREFCKEEDIS